MKNNDIKIKHRSSSLSEFVQRQMPSDEEAEAFDKFAEDEAKSGEIDDSLKNIYRDERGNQVDVKKLTIKRQRGFIFKLVTFLIVTFVVAGSIYGAYNYIYLKVFSGQTTVSLNFDAVKEVAAGEEFFYDLNYKNEDKVGIHGIEIKAVYPDNFIFISSEPSPAAGNNTWNIASLGSHRSDSIRIKGKLIGTADSVNTIAADLTYTPDNFSSEFRKSASFDSAINSSGLDISFNSASSANIGDENEISVVFAAQPENFLDAFRLTVSHPDEVAITNSGQGAATSTQGLAVAAAGPDSWLFNNLGKNKNEFKIKFKITDKKQPAIDLKLTFEYPYAAQGQPVKYYKFLEQNLPFDVIKSDLNLNLLINGSPLDQGIDFGQTLNYSVNYANKGLGPMKNVIIMAILESDFLDWQSLSDKNNGLVSGNAISWTNREIPALASLDSGADGTIDFSIKLKPRSDIDLNKAYQVKSYVNYSIGGKSPAGGNQSNIVINKINSDLDFSEQVRYFNDDNVAVGSGPLPPKVGQATSLKVYWTIKNSLHQLNNLAASVALPANVSWDGKSLASIGNVSYDSQTNRVIWQIGQLPVTVNQASAEFSIKLTPQETDRNKIVVILPEATAGAQDAETKIQINKTVKAKTTKLEDDNLADTDGIIQ